MNSSAIIIGEHSSYGLRLNGNATPEHVEALLKYLELKGYVPFSKYPELYTCQLTALIPVITIFTNWMGNDKYHAHVVKLDQPLPPIINSYTHNGVYVVNGLEIVDRLDVDEDEEESSEQSLSELLESIDQAQPEKERLGKLIHAERVNARYLKVGDKVHMPYNCLTSNHSPEATGRVTKIEENPDKPKDKAISITIAPDEPTGYEKRFAYKYYYRAD